MLNAINFFGAVALFLFGVKFLSEGLEGLSRRSIKKDLSQLNRGRFSPVIIGTFLTVILQFSSITTIFAVGMANSGIINLTQSLGLIIGANIGTTIKSHLLILNPQLLLPFFAIIGTFLFVFSRERKKKELSYVLIGLSIIIVGLHYIGLSVYELKDSKSLLEIFDIFGYNWYVLFLSGIFFTILFQSSSAMMAILIAIASTGVIGVEKLVFVILGANIGSTSTAAISSLGTGSDGKRSAFMHFLFNTIGCIVFLPLSSYLVMLVKTITPGSSQMQIALIHTLFNVLTAAIVIPFMNKIVCLSEKVIKDKEKDVEITKSAILDKRLLSSSVFAEQQIIKQTLKLASFARENVKLSVDAFIEGDDSSNGELENNNEMITYIQMQIVDFLVKLSANEVSEEDQGRIAATHIMVQDFQKIGALTENIMELAQERQAKNVVLSEDAKTEIRAMYSYVLESINIAIDSFRNEDKNLASTIVDIERHINDMEEKYREMHIKRLNRGKCTPISGILYLDVLGNMERIGDLTSNICSSIIKNIKE